MERDRAVKAPAQDAGAGRAEGGRSPPRVCPAKDKAREWGRAKEGGKAGGWGAVAAWGVAAGEKNDIG
ncbi:MAG: hypothetical protein AB1696_24750 [Planctomycetota bacterium]